jgi:hypothetical protein
MLTHTRADGAASLPRPSELLPGCPDAVVDLQTEAGVQLVHGKWHYSDARVAEIEFVEVGHPDDPLGPGIIPNRTYDVLPHAQAGDYDDSDWRVLAPTETQLVLGELALVLLAIVTGAGRPLSTYALLGAGSRS